MNIVFGQYSTNEIPLGQSLKERNVTLTAYIRNSLCIVGKGYISQNKEKSGFQNKQNKNNEGKILTTDLWSGVYHQQVLQQSKLDLILKEQQRLKRNQRCANYIRNTESNLNFPANNLSNRTQKTQISPKGTPFSNKRQKTQDSIQTRPSTQHYGYLSQEQIKGSYFERKGLSSIIIENQNDQDKQTYIKSIMSPKELKVDSLNKQSALFHSKSLGRLKIANQAEKIDKMNSNDFRLPLQSIIDNCDDQIIEKKANKKFKPQFASIYKRMLF